MVNGKVSQSEFTTLENLVQTKVSDDQFQSSFTQLSNQINLRVEKEDVINQINISPESILIVGNKIHISGRTTIDKAVIETTLVS